MLKWQNWGPTMSDTKTTISKKESRAKLWKAALASIPAGQSRTFGLRTLNSIIYRDEYLAVNAAAYKLWGKGAYQLARYGNGVIVGRMTPAYSGGRRQGLVAHLLKYCPERTDATNAA
jgi:hypothetical protein